MSEEASAPSDPELHQLRSTASSGAPEAAYRLAAGLVVRGQMEEALSLHKSAAAAGHSGAQIEYARMLLFGIGTPPDERLAVDWLSRAEGAGSPVAGYLLAMIALGGVVLPRDGRINARMLAAVQSDYPPALRAAAIHLGRRNNAADQVTCLRLLQRAAERGDALSAQLLAQRLLRGEGCLPQENAAAEIFATLKSRGHPPVPEITAPLPGPVMPLRASGELRPGMLAFEEALQPAPWEMLSSQPRVMQIDQLLSVDECRLLIAAAQPHLQISQTVDPRTGKPVPKEIRTSSDCSFDPVMEDFSLRMVQLRIARSARVELVQGEHLTVLRYAPGQEYRPHRDYVPPGSIERDRPGAGNRLRTICVYLNHVPAGGETEFPVAGVRVSPQPGRAIVFDNLTADGQPDPDSLHAGLPVLEGEKWLATLWLRQRPYRRF